MKKIFMGILIVFYVSFLLLPNYAYADKIYSKDVDAENIYVKDGTSIITATGKDVPIDSELSEEYRVPEKYIENAVQFVTGDGILLCGYVLGEGNKGITLGHANGWMVKSWLPFGERLVDAGYMIIIWEFRNIAPSGFAEGDAQYRWDLDVLAAVEVLRERGATEILSMGASMGGTATVAAAPDIPELVGLGILSSPAQGLNIDPLAAIRKVHVPAFFAVSADDAQGVPGVYRKEVEALYEACASTQKQLHVLEGLADHGTDMLAEDSSFDRYSTTVEEDRQQRKELADNLMLFINEAFGKNADESSSSETDSSETDGSEADSSEADTSEADADGADTSAAAADDSKTPTRESELEEADFSESNKNNSVMYLPLIGAGILILVIILIILLKRKNHHKTP